MEGIMYLKLTKKKTEFELIKYRDLKNGKNKVLTLNNAGAVHKIRCIHLLPLYLQ